jgi:lipopolysaccharide transport system ATP-binding protein
MSNTAIKVENLSKVYRLGEIGTGSIGQDVDRWFKTKILGKEDPFLKIGETNDRANKGKSDIVYSLQDINFEIQQGDAVGIIGRNGAGKSTLLKILSRVTTPTTGKINIKGRVASLLEVGTGFHPELTGRENIYLNGAILGMRKREIDRKLDEIIDFSGVERYIDTPVKRYSSGMYVRLAFAVAAHLESEILIVDEVLAVGDAEFQKKCLGKMGEVSKGEGRTVLFVSHNMGSVKNLCNKGIFLKNGLLEYQGDVITTLDLYQNTNIISSDVEKIFTNKHNLPVFISKVILLVNGKKPEFALIDFMDLISFEIIIEVNKVVKNRGIVIHCNDNYERLFQAFDISIYPELFDGREVGKHKLIIHFEQTFLREGLYSFDFEVGHFGVGSEQLETNAVAVKVEVISRNPRFEAAAMNRNNKIYIEPKWTYCKL